MEVSDSTLREDRVLKTALYARAGVPEFWIVNLPERRLEAFRQPSADGYGALTVFLEAEAAAPLAAPDAAIRVADLLPPPPPPAA